MKILRALKSLREQESATRGVEPYRVFQNKTIDEIARKQPSTNVELLDITGIGPKKSKRYGGQILQIVQQAKESVEVSQNQNDPGEPKVYSVGEFLDVLNLALGKRPVTVQGEIYGEVQNRGRATYFKLKDSEEEAILSCFAWSNILEESEVELEEGMEVTARGLPHVYKPNGRFSLQVQELSFSGEGALKKAFEKLKARLEKEGLFAVKRKRPLPEYITSVGLITASGSDAKSDFITHLGKHGIEVREYDVRVEGSRAVSNITEALEFFNNQGEPVDVVVLTRGGGSLESLQAFNHERVARALSASRVPTIVGVGHEKDVSIADLVADVRASTPTHAGKIIHEVWQEKLERITSLHKNMVGVIRESIRGGRVSLREYTRTLSDSMLNRFQKKEIVIRETKMTLQSFSRLLRNLLEKLEQGLKHATVSLSRRLSYRQGDLEIFTRQMTSSLARLISDRRRQLNSLQNNLTLSDPAKRLKQGYSIVFDKEGRVIKKKTQVSHGDEVTLRLSDGEQGAEIV